MDIYRSNFDRRTYVQCNLIGPKATSLLHLSCNASTQSLFPCKIYVKRQNVFFVQKQGLIYSFPRDFKVFFIFIQPSSTWGNDSISLAHIFLEMDWFNQLTTLPETNIAPKQWWFSNRNLRDSRGLFSRASFREGSVTFYSFSQHYVFLFISHVVFPSFPSFPGMGKKAIDAVSSAAVLLAVSKAKRWQLALALTSLRSSRCPKFLGVFRP